MLFSTGTVSVQKVIYDNTVEVWCLVSEWLKSSQIAL